MCVCVCVFAGMTVGSPFYSGMVKMLRERVRGLGERESGWKGAERKGERMCVPVERERGREGCGGVLASPSALPCQAKCLPPPSLDRTAIFSDHSYWAHTVLVES